MERVGVRARRKRQGHLVLLMPTLEGVGMAPSFMPAARVGDSTVHGGVITVGFPQVMIG